MSESRRNLPVALQSPGRAQPTAPRTQLVEARLAAVDRPRREIAMLRRRAPKERVVIRAQVVVQTRFAHLFVRRDDDQPKTVLSLVQQPERLGILGATALDLLGYLEPFASRQREIASRLVGRGRVVEVSSLNGGHFGHLADRPLYRCARQALSEGRHFHGDSKRLGFRCVSASLFLGCCRVAASLLLGLCCFLLCRRLGFCRLTPSFGLFLRQSLRLCLCCQATSLRFRGLALCCRL